ncbi:hypothetical protein D3C87_01900 [compost metagenome]
MYRFLIFLLFFQIPTAQSQRIFSASGVLVSFLDLKSEYQTQTINDYSKGMIQSSISLGFETKSWHRISLTVSAVNFNSGGRRTSPDPTYFSSYEKMIFNNSCLGISGNYYIIDKKTQLYIGIGPRVDYIRSEREIFHKLIGDSYQKEDLRTFQFGISGSIGVNFQLENFYWGFKSNYYYRHGYLFQGQSFGSNLNGVSSFIKSRTIRDNVFDLQVVFGYQFRKNKSDKNSLR